MSKLKEILKGPSGKKIVAGAMVLVLGATGLIIAGKRKTVTLAYDGKTEVVTTYKSTVGGVIEGEQIALHEKDKVSHQLNDNLEKDMTIAIKRAIPIKIEESGKVKEIKTSATTVSDVLKEEKIALNAKDKITPGVNEKLTSDMKVNITRVTEEMETVSEVIPFTVKKEADKSLAEGTTKVVTEGTNGRKEITTKTVYENGKAVSTQKVAEKVACKPVAKLISVGAKPKQVVVTASRGGRALDYKKVLTMVGTAYSQAPYDPTGGGSITATGTRVKRDANGTSTVAVDPSVIPLGTKLYVEGYGYAIAADTGGAVKGNKIDLYFNPGSEYKNWGKRTVKVYILD